MACITALKFLLKPSLKPYRPMPKFCSLLVFAGLIALLTACKDKQRPAGSTPPPKIDSSQNQVDMRLLEGEPITLYISSSEATVHEAPKADVPVLKRFSKGDSLLFSNAVSNTATKAEVEGLSLQQIWLRVILPDKQMGWIHGATLRFDAKAHPALAELLYDARMQQLFGARWYRKLQRYRREITDLRTLIAFEMLFQEGQALRDSLHLGLERQLGGYKAGSPIPDFLWLDQELPGFRIQEVQDSVQPYRLLEDFAFWHQKAAATPEQADDAFVRIFLAAYPDSIAQPYGSWQKLFPPDTLYSLLGRGRHLAIALQMDEAPALPPYLQQVVQQLQTRLLDDISLSERYWMSSEQAVAELEQLLNLPDTVFQRSMRIELSGRKAILAEPELHGIEMHADSSAAQGTAL